MQLLIMLVPKVAIRQPTARAGRQMREQGIRRRTAHWRTVDNKGIMHKDPDRAWHCESSCNRFSFSCLPLGPDGHQQTSSTMSLRMKSIVMLQSVTEGKGSQKNQTAQCALGGCGHDKYTGDRPQHIMLQGVHLF